MSTHVKNNVYWDPHNKVHEWSPSQVAEDVVRLLLVGQEVSTLSHGPPWTPPRPNSSISAEEIAESLDDYFCSIFREVSRKDWIQAALGYDTASVAILLEEGLNTRLVLYQWFKQTTLPTNTHELVEGVCYVGAALGIKRLKTLRDSTIAESFGVLDCLEEYVAIWNGSSERGSLLLASPF